MKFEQVILSFGAGIVVGWLINNFCNNKIEEQAKHIKELENTINNRLSALESNTYNLQNQHSQIITELEYIKTQIKNDESKKLMTELIQRVKQKYNEKIVDSKFYN
jgi:uncharacterized membrane-anchored protein YhcB (DUF1043 family)